MIELIQFPWSPFCIVQRRILEYSGLPFKITNVPNGDRSLVWKITREQYYAVPVIRDGDTAVFESGDNTQDVAKFLDQKLQLGLFPPGWEGVQSILWTHIEDAVETPCFQLNDIYWEEFVPTTDRLRFVRHKERKFGRGCLNRWRDQQKALLKQLERVLIPYEQSLMDRPFLLTDRPLFVDFDLYGMLSNFLFSNHYKLPRAHRKLAAWHRRMAGLQLTKTHS